MVPLRKLTVRIATQLQLQVDGLPQRRLQLVTGYAHEAWGWPSGDGGAQLEGQKQGFVLGWAAATVEAGEVGAGVQGDPMALAVDAVPLAGDMHRCNNPHPEACGCGG